MLPLLLVFVCLQTPSPGAPADSRADLEASRDRYEAVLAATPQDPSAQTGEVEVSERLALAARAAQDQNTALGDLLRAQKLVPESPRLLFDLGVLEEQIGLYRDAGTTAEHLRALTPADPKTVYLAARVELDLGQLGSAERDMRTYLQAQPGDATAHFGLGRILENAGQGTAAKAEFQRSIELQPGQTESFYHLGQLALQAGDFPAVLAADATVLERNPHHGGALTATGIAYFREKRYPEAETALQRAVTEAPEYQLGHYYHGLVLARLGKKEESTRELALAAKMAEDDNKRAAGGLRLNPQ